MSDASPAGAILLVRLYELRLSEPYRSAARWLERELAAVSWRDVEDRHPPGSDDHDALRLVIEHWELVAALTLTGAIDEGLFFTSTGEHLTVWSKLQPWLEDARTALGDPTFLDSFELLVRRHAEWLRRTPPRLARNAERRSAS